MDKLPQRDDLIYKEIEEFQDYELTNCVAYEMLIRNEEFIYLLNEVKELRKNFSKIAKIFAQKNNIILKEKLLAIIEEQFDDFMIFRKKIIKDKLNSIEQKFGLRLFDIYEDKNILNDLEEVFKRGNREIRNTLILIKDDGKKELEFISSECSKITLPTTYSIKDVSNNLGIPTIRPNLHLEKMKETKIKLNLNLPKKELIAYLSKIKDEYDKNNSIIKTPLELLGETLEKSDNKKTPKKPKASVYADWFYIYDYWKYEKALGKTDKDIFVALEVEKNILYGEENIRKIRDKMKYFIDDLGYKELITGVKNT